MEFKPREPYGDTAYMESDRDFALNNLELCVEILEKIEATGKTDICLEKNVRIL